MLSLTASVSNEGKEERAMPTGALPSGAGQLSQAGYPPAYRLWLLWAISSGEAVFGEVRAGFAKHTVQRLVVDTDATGFRFSEDIRMECKRLQGMRAGCARSTSVVADERLRSLFR